MTQFRFAILKELKNKTIELAQFPNEQYLEYDEGIFVSRLISEMKTDSINYGKTTMLNKQKLFNIEEIEKMTRKAFDNVINEIKRQSIRAK